ncbi:adenosine deaminase [Nonomuraea sp. NBC_01738]|uniref:adenosine deaminase n=1 Tax=Nonomuraea sp. NBC_01738 TaxID=2976003 RepID=UPI002E0E2535|nr:adenosine deaminase [Nonomuraea sp. NBC_01738]
MPRPLNTLPKAHLHLHFTGSMRHSTLIELAREQGLHLPDALEQDWPPKLRATDERGWFRFQRLYDIARSVLTTPEHVFRLMREAAEDEAAEGSRWLEIQVDPSGFAPRFGGLTSTLELMLESTRRAAEHAGIGIAVIVAANRTRHPLDANTLARLAVQYTDHGVVGFGLSNDERRGEARDFERAFRIARRAGLISVPHGGELLGPRSIEQCVSDLDADRVGHGIRATESPRLMERLADRQIACEVCPSSNVGLGVSERAADVPVRKLFEAGVPIALGADDPLLFGSRLLKQYELARDVYEFTDTEIAELARQSIRSSTAPESVRKELLQGVDDWLTA